MQIRLTLRQELKQKIELEQKLQQKITQQQKLKITLKQYLFLEDQIKHLITWAGENNGWKQFDKHGFRFRYAAVPYKEAQTIADKMGPGFAHCMYNPFEAMFTGQKIALATGDWTLFLVKDEVPEDLAEFVILHERGEELSLGNHYFASQLEFAMVSKTHKIRDYARYIDRNMPTKFVDLTEKYSHPILPDELREILDQQGKRNNKEAELAENIINKNPIPYTILKKMHKYESATEQVCKAILGARGTTQASIHQASAETFGRLQAEDAARLVNRHLAPALLTISPEEVRGVSPARASESLKEYKEIVWEMAANYVNGHVSIPHDFQEAYQKATNRHEIAQAHHTLETRKRMDPDNRIKGFRIAANY